ncbi:MAG: DUF3035 domain-containing protein [Rickettsiaceae bacterium]
MHYILVLFFVLINLASCAKVKKYTGIAVNQPDEYQVKTNHSLEIPPHYHLPLPTHESFQEKDEDLKNSTDEGRIKIQDE